VHNAKLTLAAQWAPVKDFIVDFNAERTYSESTFENFRVENQEYVPLNSTVAGNFGMSTILIKTAFNRLRGVTNPSFEVFRANRFEIARRMARERGLPLDGLGNEGYPKGLGKDQQDVIIAAFLSAYTDTATDKIGLSPIQKTPLPNWNLKYGGLRDIPMFKKVFRRFTLTHAYRASMTINNFQTNLDYDPNNPLQLDDAGNFVSEQLYSNINLVEQFNPLLRVDAEFSNSLRVLAELKRDRAFSLSLDNNLLTETSGSEYIVGLGYRIKDLRLRTNLGGKRTTLKGDLNLKADFSYRNNLTILRNLEYNDNQVTAGQTLMSLKITADYALSKNLTSLFFYDHNFSRFGISTAFPQTSIRSGFTIRYNFGN
jgi:cell surface protein SprA